jgi:hypothetical protein
MSGVLAVSINTFWAIVCNAMVIGGAVGGLIGLPILISMIPHRDTSHR